MLAGDDPSAQEAPQRVASSLLTPEQLADFDARFPNEQSSQWLDTQVAHRDYAAIAEQLPSFAPSDPRSMNFMRRRLQATRRLSTILASLAIKIPEFLGTC